VTGDPSAATLHATTLATTMCWMHLPSSGEPDEQAEKLHSPLGDLVSEGKIQMVGQKRLMC